MGKYINYSSIKKLSSCNLFVKQSGLLLARKFIFDSISCMEQGEKARFCCEVPLEDMM